MVIPLLGYVMVWFVWFGGLGVYVASQCGRSRLEGMALGFLLGPLGVLAIASLPHGEPEPADSQFAFSLAVCFVFILGVGFLFLLR
jgi:hypothetical protein